MWTEVVTVLHGAKRLGHHPAHAHGRLLLRAQCRPHRGYPLGGKLEPIRILEAKRLMSITFFLTLYKPSFLVI